MSSRVMRPPGPLPGTRARSTPTSRAKRRTAGPAATVAASLGPADDSADGARVGLGSIGLCWGGLHRGGGGRSRLLLRLRHGWCRFGRGRHAADCLAGTAGGLCFSGDCLAAAFGGGLLAAGSGAFDPPPLVEAAPSRVRSNVPGGMLWPSLTWILATLPAAELGTWSVALPVSSSMMP